VNPSLSRLSTTGVPYSVLLSDKLTNPVNSSTGNVTSIYTDAGLRGDVVPSKNTVRPAKEATVTLTTEQIDAILKTLRDAPDKESQRKAVEELQKVLQKMQEQVK
jgi:hypothetical protein